LCSEVDAYAYAEHLKGLIGEASGGAQPLKSIAPALKSELVTKILRALIGVARRLKLKAM
jgi:hypothetical protein